MASSSYWNTLRQFVVTMRVTGLYNGNCDCRANGRGCGEQRPIVDGIPPPMQQRGEGDGQLREDYCRCRREWFSDKGSLFSKRVVDKAKLLRDQAAVTFRNSALWDRIRQCITSFLSDPCRAGLQRSYGQEWGDSENGWGDLESRFLTDGVAESSVKTSLEVIFDMHVARTSIVTEAQVIAAINCQVKNHCERSRRLRFGGKSPRVLVDPGGEKATDAEHDDEEPAKKLPTHDSRTSFVDFRTKNTDPSDVLDDARKHASNLAPGFLKLLRAKLSELSWSASPSALSWAMTDALLTPSSRDHRGQLKWHNKFFEKLKAAGVHSGYARAVTVAQELFTWVKQSWSDFKEESLAAGQSVDYERVQHGYLTALSEAVEKMDREELP